MESVEVVRARHAENLKTIFNATTSADDFAVAFNEYCKNKKELEWLPSQFQDFVVQGGFKATKNELYDKVVELLDYIELN